MEKKPIDFTRGIFFLMLFLCIITGGVILKITAPVIIPVTLAILLSFVFLPVIRNMNVKLHIPWWIGIIVMFVLFFILFFAVAKLLITSFRAILESVPKYENRLVILYSIIAEKLQLPYDEGQSLFANLWGQLSIRSAIKQFAVGFTGTLYDFSRNTLTVVLFSIFLLAEMHFTRTKIEAAFHGKVRGRVKHIIQNVITQITRYISIKFIISLATGACVFAVTLSVGMDFPMVWGFLAFIMNFIPTFGSLFSCLITILFAILQFYPAPFPIFVISIVLIAVNFILGNVVEPRIEGNNLGVSPFVILVSLSLWGWMWGFVGMILAVPIMVILKIICENISFLHPIAIMLGNRVQDTEQELSPIDGSDDIPDSAVPPPGQSPSTDLLP